MGLSASQARLLSITARLSDNELHSQQIANAKVRLADQTQQASADYIKALDSTKLVYTTYDANGEQSCVDLTPGLMYTYSPLKNQYGLVDSVGKLLVTPADAANFEASANLTEFLEINDCPLTENPKYEPYLIDLFGNNYATYFDTETGTPKPPYLYGNSSNNYNVNDLDIINMIGNNPYYDVVFYSSSPGQKTIFDRVTSGEIDPDFISQYMYNYTWGANAARGILSGDYSNVKNDTDGSDFYKLLAAISEIPEWPGDVPLAEALPEMPNLADLANAYNGSQCHSAVAASDGGIGHMEHNLAALIWGRNGLGVNSSKTIQNSAGTITIVNKESACGTSSGFSLSGFSFSDSGNTGYNLVTALKNSEQYECIRNLEQELIDLYCDVVNYLDKNYKNPVDNPTDSTTKLDPTSCSVASTASVCSASSLVTRWNAFYTHLTTVNAEADSEYDAAMEAYRASLLGRDVWIEKCQDVLNWGEMVREVYNKFLEKLKGIPLKMIPDENDSKTQWYINLWHRMNGESDYKSAEGELGTYYKQLDSNFVNSSSWINFALKNGIATLEKVQFVGDAEDITGLKHTKWQSLAFSSAADIHEVDDEKAIAKAEAEYTKKLNEIEAKDKKYDSDIKKLDTEHNALKTEYESVQTVISKNVERSFKAFS